MEIATIECKRIHDWESFHSEFDRVFGFPDFYGENMDAWIDCLSSIDCPEEGMTKIHCKAGDTMTILLKDAKEFKLRCPAQWEALNECAAFVSWRVLEQGQRPLLSLAYYA